MAERKPLVLTNGIIEQLQTGDSLAGFSQATQTYIHQQTTPSVEWVITHNLSKRPAVTIVNSLGETVLGAVEYVSDNEIVVRFRVGFGGDAYLN